MKVWLRSDSLSSRFDFPSIATSLKSALPQDVQVVHTQVWFNMSFPISVERAIQIAELVLKEVADRIQ